MTSKANRRAVLAGALAAGALGPTAALPAAVAQSPSLSAVDHRVLDLWRRRARLSAIVDRLYELDDDRCAEAAYAKCDVERIIAEYIGASILALGGFLITDIGLDDDDERVLRAYRASLAAIRPQLVGAIAEDADRVLAQDREEAQA